MADFLELRIGDLRRLDAADFGAHGRGQGPYLDVLVAGRVVVELAGWMKAHAGALWFSCTAMTQG